MTAPFSDEVPELLITHLEHLKKSAISVDVIKERGYRSALGKTPIRELGFAQAQQRAPGIIIPIHGPDGKNAGYLYRPDKPRMDGRRQRPIKYELPLNSSVRLDVPPRCRQHLGDPHKPLYFTEGIKKVDSLATAGVCAVGLIGVWGFRGKNAFGGTAILADFDYLALKGRTVYLAFDSDSATNPQVAGAVDRLTEHLNRKEAVVRVLHLPQGTGGEKVGVDDYLAQGHTIDELIKLEDNKALPPAGEQPPPERPPQTYVMDGGKTFWKKASNSGGYELVPLCNFTAKITEDIQKDNGLELTRVFKVAGEIYPGKEPPIVEVLASRFSSMNWVMDEWGGDAVITAGQMIKDRIREAIQVSSRNMLKKRIFTHTGWREIDGKRVFLIGAGSIGSADIETAMEPQLQRYSLPPPGGNLIEAFTASKDFLLIGNLEVTLPLWAAMYLAPLSEIIDPAFTLWYTGPSGAFKSTLTALALCHFGDFDENHLPASWRDTENLLEKLCFLAKDIPLIIDDWSPGMDPSRARELEGKAEHIIRAQGNRQGKGRMRADTSSRPNYIPRGVLITSGEQLPSGFSNTARIYSVPIEKEDVYTDLMATAEEKRTLYARSMAHYITWLQANYEKLKKDLPPMWNERRNKAQKSDIHPRLPGCVASLYAGLYAAVTFAVEKKAMDPSEGNTLLNDGWTIFTKLAAEQGRQVEQERPAVKFLRGLRAILEGGTAVLKDKNDISAFEAPPGKTLIGWEDYTEELILLIPELSYRAVYQHFASSGDSFTIKKDAVGQDLKRMGYTSIEGQPRATTFAWIGGRSKRVWPLKRKLLEESGE